MKSIFIASNENLHRELEAIGAARTPSIAISAFNDSLHKAAGLLSSEAPQLVIFDASNCDAGEFAALEKLTAQHPQTAFMLLSPDQSPQFLIRAMRAGAREVLPLPLDAKSVNEALERVVRKASAQARHGKIISFISCKGGSGATFLATNFGHALAAQRQKKVLLIDLNQQFGDAALYVSDQKPAMTLSDVCAQIGRLDAAFLESCLIEVSPGFGILAASDDPARSSDLTPEHIETILRLARGCYDYIILDVGRQIDAVTIRALDNADLIHPVLQLALPYLRDGRRLLDIFRALGYARDKIRPIVNRYEAGGKLQISDLESVLGGVAACIIPNNYTAVSESINQGVPILNLARRGAVAKNLIGLAEKTAGLRHIESKGLLERLFNLGQFGRTRA